MLVFMPLVVGFGDKQDCVYGVLELLLLGPLLALLGGWTHEFRNKLR